MKIVPRDNFPVDIDGPSATTIPSKEDLKTEESRSDEGADVLEKWKLQRPQMLPEHREPGGFRPHLNSGGPPAIPLDKSIRDTNRARNSAGIGDNPLRQERS